MGCKADRLTVVYPPPRSQIASTAATTWMLLCGSTPMSIFSVPRSHRIGDTEVGIPASRMGCGNHASVEPIRTWPPTRWHIARGRANQKCGRRYPSLPCQPPSRHHDPQPATRNRHTPAVQTSERSVHEYSVSVCARTGQAREVEVSVPASSVLPKGIDLDTFGSLRRRCLVIVLVVAVGVLV